MKKQDIAIIGIACRFPGAKNYHEYWKNLVQGVNSIKEIPPERWSLDQFYSPTIDDPNKSVSKWCGLLDNIDQFDNRFFSISPREAKNMDPQQRLLLEETWHCIEDSCVSPKTLQEKKTSVYVGVMALDYYQEASASDVVIDSYAALGNYECILANRLSHTFGLQGESISINAACASSLVALHHAKVALQSGDSDYAFVGGVSLDIQPWKYISFSKSRMLSPDGQCKTFDKDANGYVPGEGVAVLLLQPLEKAISTCHHIYGIIKGTAVNHGGQTLSITAPSVEAQRDVILAAYKDAKLTPETTTYVEAHGTGTSLGDPVEVEALTLAFREYTDDDHFCELGSVKTNIGHLEAAAGIAGIIKVLMMMRHQEIPPILNLKTINPVINFEYAPFVLATSLRDWHSRKPDLPLRAGVSSFGFGGVNAHTLLESYPAQSPTEEVSGDLSHLFLISAKSPNALKNTQVEWHNFIESEEYSKYNLIDICATLKTVRTHFPYRYGVYVKTKDELKTFLQKEIPTLSKPVSHEWCLRIGTWDNFSDIQPLLEQEPLIKKHLNIVQQCLSTLDLKEQLKKEEIWLIKQPLYSFMVGYAYLSALIELGFTPKLITGEKDGLWLTLTLSGMMTLKDTLAILSHQKNLEQIKLARPNFPFYDIVSQQTLLPFHFDENYLQFLIDDLNIAQADMVYFIEKTLLLKNKQFTFKKYLDDWDIILHQHANTNLDAMLSKKERTAKEKIILLLIIKSSLRQLEQKWELSRPKRIAEHKFHELLDLVTDGVMPKEALIKFFFKGESAAMVAFMNKRQEQINLKKPYKFLKIHTQKNPVINNVRAWFKSAMENTNHYPSPPNFISLTFGKTTEHIAAKSPEHVNITETQSNVFKETLLQLWLHSVEIKWKKLFPEGTFNKISLPTYGFDRIAFWLKKEEKPGFVKRMLLTEQTWSDVLDQLLDGRIPKETVIKIISSDNPELAIKIADVNLDNPETYQRTLSHQDSIIRNHIITGKPMLAGACMIEFGLDAIQKTINKPVKKLRNIVFKNPGLIEANVEIEVNINKNEKSFVLKTNTHELCEGEYE